MLSERPWKLESVLRLAMLVLGSFSAGILLMLLTSQPLARALDLDVEFVTHVMGFLSVQGLALVWVSVFMREHDLTWTEAFGFRHAPVPSAGLACAVMIVVLPLTLLFMGTVVAALLRWFGINPEAQVTVLFIKKHPPGWELAVMGFTAVVLAPLAEEALFRGVLYTALKQRGHPRLALVGTAALFAAIHFNLAALLPLFFLALVFTWLYERTGNLIAPIAAHMMFNAVNFVALVTDLPQWLEKMFTQ